MGRHAYLIIAHDKWKQLQFLIDILNDSRNDFFLLTDLKSKDFDRDLFLQDCSSKNIFLIEPISIHWGDYSQIEAEVSLLKAATSKGSYSYYHLISAVDMPLCSQDTLHNFFDSHQGLEFVDYDNYNDISRALERINYYYYFQKLIGRKRKNVLKIARDVLLLFEKILKVNRAKDIEQYLGKGANWFSITDDFARYVVEQEQFILDHFKQTFCADEVFLQTLLKMSPYKDNWYGFQNSTIQYQNLRFCDWERGAPYTFHKEDFFELCSNSEYMYARKFSEDIISEEVKNYLCTSGKRENNE